MRVTVRSRPPLVHLYLIPLAAVMLDLTNAQSRSAGDNCYPVRGMHGACGRENGKELACLEIDGYFQCARARRIDEPCGADYLFNVCEVGLYCTAAWGICRPSARVGEFCSATPDRDIRNICGMQGFCDVENGNICRDYITSTVLREDPCPPDTNHGWRECHVDLTCELHYSGGGGNEFGLCVPRHREGDRCSVYSCRDGLTCLGGICRPYSGLDGQCEYDWDCNGNMECVSNTGRCALRVGVAPTVPPPPPPPPTPRPVASPTRRPTRRPTPRPNAAPTRRPTPRPVASPTRRPTPRPVASPTRRPTPRPSPRPNASPTKRPTPRPNASPTRTPTHRPSPRPVARPTRQPTPRPVASPTRSPTPRPIASPTRRPTPQPISSPTRQPTPRPVVPPPLGSPTARPTPRPSASPTQRPTPMPITAPTLQPTAPPVAAPTGNPPSLRPTALPEFPTTSNPTRKPSVLVSSMPSSPAFSMIAGLPTPSPADGNTQLPIAKMSAEPTITPMENTGNPSFTTETQIGENLSATPTTMALNKGSESSTASSDPGSDTLGLLVGISIAAIFTSILAFSLGYRRNKRNKEGEHGGIAPTPVPEIDDHNRNDDTPQATPVAEPVFGDGGNSNRDGNVESTSGGEEEASSLGALFKGQGEGSTEATIIYAEGSIIDGSRNLDEDNNDQGREQGGT